MQAAARKAASVQRTTFFSMIRIKDCLVLNGSNPQKLSADTIAGVKADIGRSADDLIEAYTPLLPPNCERAPAHLQMAALALGAQRTLFRAAAAADYKPASSLEVRWVVGGALGVVAPPAGEEPWAVPVNYVPNRLSMIITGSIWLPNQRKSMVTRMLTNWRKDLGEAFDVEPMDPEPSCRMTRCLYTDFLRHAGESEAPVLVPLFHCLHAATFKGVHGFSASEAPGKDGEPLPVFRFE